MRAGGISLIIHASILFLGGSCLVSGAMYLQAI